MTTDIQPPNTKCSYSDVYSQSLTLSYSIIQSHKLPVERYMAI